MEFARHPSGTLNFKWLLDFWIICGPLIFSIEYSPQTGCSILNIVWTLDVLRNSQLNLNVVRMFHHAQL